METNTKNALVLFGGTIAGAFGGRWLTPRVGAAIGVTFGPWGAVAGATIGAVLGAAVASRLMGDFDMAALADPGSARELESD